MAGLEHSLGMAYHGVPVFGRTRIPLRCQSKILAAASFVGVAGEVPDRHPIYVRAAPCSPKPPCVSGRRVAGSKPTAGPFPENPSKRQGPNGPHGRDGGGGTIPVEDGE